MYSATTTATILKLSLLNENYLVGLTSEVLFKFNESDGTLVASTSRTPLNNGAFQHLLIFDKSIFVSTANGLHSYNNDLAFIKTMGNMFSVPSYLEVIDGLAYWVNFKYVSSNNYAIYFQFTPLKINITN